MTPTTAAVTADKRGAERTRAAQRLDIGRTEKHPEKAGREGDPGDQQSRQCSRQQRRQHLRAPIAGEKADILHDHDERARCRLGHAETGQHLAGAQPVISLDRLLRDIGQHGIGAAETDDGDFAEEHRETREDIIRAEQQESSTTGASHSGSQTATTLMARASDGRACSGILSPSRSSSCLPCAALPPMA